MAINVERVRVKVLLRSLWQTINIGDVAHAPGTLRAFQRFAPDVELVLWPRSIGDREQAMLDKHLPEVRIVHGDLDEEHGPTTPELNEAFDSADILLHGPASGIGAAPDLVWWGKNVGKPYGFFGVSLDPVSHPEFGKLARLAEMIDALPNDHLRPDRREVLDGASFVFCRDCLTVGYLRAQGIRTPVLEFGPDATFVYDIHDEAAADKVLAAHNLEPGRFVCVIPRLRYTPYYKIRGSAPTDNDHFKDAENEKYRVFEMSRMRDLIATVVRAGLKVLVCPEMIYEVELGQTDLADPLPADVRASVEVLPYYWPLEEAAAVYARAHSVVSMECHSPIMSVVTKTPTIYVRQPTDTIKGHMWPDLELADSLVEIDEIPAGELEGAWNKIHLDRTGAVERTARGARIAENHLRRMVNTAVAAINAGSSAG